MCRSVYRLSDHHNVWLPVCVRVCVCVCVCVCLRMTCCIPPCTNIGVYNIQFVYQRYAKTRLFIGSQNVPLCQSVCLSISGTQKHGCLSGRKNVSAVYCKPRTAIYQKKSGLFIQAQHVPVSIPSIRPPQRVVACVRACVCACVCVCLH